MSRAQHLSLTDTDVLVELLDDAHRRMTERGYPLASSTERREVTAHATMVVDPSPARHAARRLPRRRPDLSTMMRQSRDIPQCPGSWADLAACKHKTEVMFSRSPGVVAHRESRAERLRQQVAIDICMTCPVLGPCRDWALTDPDPAVDAVAGGMTPMQRNQWRLNRSIP